MDRYAVGEDAAFAIVYGGLASRLLAFLRRGTGDSALAEDILQQTFLQMHAARERYKTGMDVVPWAFAIARRLRIDAYRRSGREVLGKETSDVVSQAPSPHDDLALRRTTEALRRSLDALPPAQREVYELVEGEGLTMAQAASALGTSVMAVKLRIFRARQRLQTSARELL